RLQQQILKVLERDTDLPARQIGIGVDGCSAPVFYLPVRRMALMYARLAEARDQTAERVFQAMVRYPEMIAGTGRLDTELMEVGDGRIVAKLGAEAIRCAAVRDEEPFGVALKIEDGSMRASGPVLLEVLHQLGVLEDRELEALEQFTCPPITNHAGRRTGWVTAHFTLTHVPQAEEEKVAEMKIEELQERVKADPDNPDYHLELGIAYGELKQLDRAAEHLEKAVELAPDRADIQYNLGVIYSMAMTEDLAVEELWESYADEEELYHLAEQAFLRALELDPELAQAYNNLGTLYSLWGRTEDAVKCWRKSLELDPDHPDIREAIAEVTGKRE
ncbi:MAG: asparaginase, partial [Acidobacteriota bacterium]